MCKVSLIPYGPLYCRLGSARLMQMDYSQVLTQETITPELFSAISSVIHNLVIESPLRI